MENVYEPELGQMLFGQPTQEYKVEQYLEDALRAIKYAFDVLYLDEDNPFGNVGTSFKNGVFEVEAYSWDENYDQPYNFKWNDVEVSWYKYFARGISVNRQVTAEEARLLLIECLKSLLE